MADNLKNNFDDCMQLINNINVDASHKTCENLPCLYTSDDKTATIEQDDQSENADAKEKICISNINLAVSNSVVFVCNGDTGNPNKTITTTENSDGFLKDSEVKQTVVNSNVAIDNLQQVLLKSDCNNEGIENSSDITEIPTGSRETVEENMRDCKQETDLLNNFATFPNVEEKSQNKLNVDVKCQAIVGKNSRMMIESGDSLEKRCGEETNSFLNVPFKCLQQARLGSADKVENKKSNTNNVVELNSISVQISEEITQVNSKDGCSQPTELFEINTGNDSKTEADSLNNLTVFDEEKKNSESKLSLNLTERLNMEVECEAVEVISELINCLTEKDVVTKISECENNHITVSEGSLDAAISSQKTNLDSYREVEERWTDDEDSSSSSSSSSGSSSDSDFFQMIVESSSGPKTVPEIKTRGELGLEDLPPIEDLTITIPKEDMMLIGVIHAVVDKLVVIHALKDMKPLDIDSVLFLTHERPLGRVYDVFGPVVEPFYCVRFNNTEDIKEKLVEIGAYVFFAPKKEDITSYVFVDELQKERGSDASWKFNNEPPEEYLDFSDDEQEKAARRNKMIKNRNQRFANSSDLAAKKPSLMSDSDSQQNLNYRPAHHQPASYKNNMNFSRASSYAPSSRSYPSRPPTPIVSNVFGGSRFSRPYLPHPPSSPTPSVSSVFDGSRFSRPYPSHPPSSPTPSVSSVLEAPRFIPFSSSYPSHPPPSPAPSVSSVLEAPRFIPYSSPFSYPPPSPSPSVSVVAAPSFSPVSNLYFPRPPSPTPSVCSVMSVAVRARSQHSFSTPRQPHPPYPQQPRAPFAQHSRSFSSQSAPQRYLTSSSNPQSHFSRTSSPQQSPSPIMLQSHQQSLLQMSFPPQNTIQRPALPPQHLIPALPPQHLIPALPPQHLIPAFPLQTQRPALSPALPYQQTHVFGQVTLMSPIATLQPPLPPPPSPINMQSFSTPPPVRMQSFIHPPGPHVPPQYPLTIQIPNLNNSSVPAINNMIQRGQPPLY